ncbi:MAG: MMPL family transporter [Planctomycetia bacterium]|nr:MMPL family transporter [Planctomycetia bacterium]
MLNKFFTRHCFKVILVAIFLLPVIARGARKTLLSNDNNVHDWLPTTYDETQDFSWFQEHFENETFVLISWDKCTLDDPRLELLAKKLVPPEVPASADPGPLNKLAPRSWNDDFFWSKWFKKPDPVGFVGPRGPLFKRVETSQRLLKRLTEPPVNLSEGEALKRLSGLFIGPDNQQSCAVVTLTQEGKRDLRVTLKKLKSVTEDELGLPPDRVRMGGPPVDNVAISVEGEKTLIRLFIPAGIVGLSLAFWCLRSVRLTTMVFAAALYAGAVSLAIVYYCGGTMNAILLTMPAVVYVAGISGAIHFANYYRDSVAESGIEGSPARAVQHSWLPCTLSAGTTAAGLISLYTSELVPIRSFGVYSAAGVLATLLLLFLFLPSWMQMWPMRPHSLLDGEQPKAEDIALPARWRKFLEGVLNHYRLVFAGLIVMMVFCGIGLTRINTSIKLTKLFSSEADIIHSYEWLEKKLGPLVPMEVVVKIDPAKCKLNFLERMELIRRIQDQMQGIKDLGNTMSAVTFAPSLEIKGGGPFKRALRKTKSEHLEQHRQEFIDGDFLDMDGQEELWRISARVGALNDVDYGEFKSEIRTRVEPVLRAQRDLLAKAAAEQPAGGGENPNEQPAENAIAATPSPADDMGITAVYTGLVPVVYKAQREMLNGLAWNFVTDLLTIAAVMTVVFWDFSAGLILLIPSVFPMVIVFGLMGWMGIVIDVGTIMTPTVALGVSVDDVVHFLIWYRRGLSEGKSRKGAIMLAYEGCARAMYQSWAVLGLGLAVFALSSFVPTQRFGALMFTLLTAALVGNLLLLPAVLASPLSHFFGRRLIKQARQEEPVAEDESTSNGAIPEPVGMQVRRDASHRVRT